MRPAPNPMLHLSFESGEDSLSVRRFIVHEGLSELFQVSVWARSPDDDLDLESFVGKAAAFGVTSGLLHALGGRRRWAGVCKSMEHLEVESTGLSLYRVDIAPHLWMLTQRQNHRLFQRKRVPDIVDALLAEWSITPEWRIGRAAYPRLELRVQYGETDFAFISRLLEEAGISYFFVDDEQAGARLILTDAPHAAEPRGGGPLPYVDNPNEAAEREYVSRVRVGREVRPGKVTLRDHDFRKSPHFELLGAAPALGTKGVEDRLEVYRYQPGASLVEIEDAPASRADAAPPASGGSALSDQVARLFDKAVDGLVRKAGSAVGSRVDALVDKKLRGLGVAGDLLGDLAGDLASAMATKIAGKVAAALTGPRDALTGDDRGVVRHDEKAARSRSQIEIEGVRATAFSIDLTTNVIDLAPGTVFSITRHPRANLGPEERLLIAALSLAGAVGEEWTTRASAVFARHAYRPRRVTPKPIMQGVQSAIVVGPRGEEIHTDELGRVRVQFHWDREGARDEQSSCWMRVSQGWAGAGYGMISIPRVGQEVLVTFLEGDPDLPLIIGTVFNGTARPPHALPDHKTRSSWRGCSSPGGAGANEIMMDDAAGRELVYLLAERDMQQIIKRDRGAVVGQHDATLAGERWSVNIAQPASPPPAIAPTGATIVDRRITFTTGEASITLDGADIVIEAKGKITVRSEGDDVVLRGGPRLLFNCSPAAARPAAASPAADAAAPAGSAGSGSGATTPATAPPKVKTGLGDGVDAGVARSPTLTAKIEQMQKDGWTIEYGAAGKGSYANKAEKRVVIDETWKGKDPIALQILAHEAGHATYVADPYVDHTGLSRQEYVDRNVLRDLKDEGEATLTNIQVRDEMVKNGGFDVGVNGSGSADYVKIAAKYPDAKDRDLAREEIGRRFATGEIPSTDPNSNYGKYYAKTYEEHYDKYAPKP